MSNDYTAGDRYLSQSSMILDMQSPTGLPRSSALRNTSDPINPSPRTTERMRHFFDGIYDLSPESHLSRFMKVILGDAGIGGLSKQYTIARQQSMLLTTRYGDLDQFYGALLGLRRLSAEVLDISPYTENATPEQWVEIDSRDAAYRARIETFARALPLGATPDGMAALGQSILGVECRIHESYLLVDGIGGNTGGAAPAVGTRTYGQIEQEYIYYSTMVGSYADIEGGHGTFGRTTTQNRAEFVVVPKRPISLEENYELIRVLSRFKPANSLLTVNASGISIHSLVKLRQVYADSTYWEVATKVAPKKEVAAAYPVVASNNSAQAQPRPPFCGYQGEAWAYNADISSVTSYTQNPNQNVVRDKYNYERIVVGSTNMDFTPNQAIADHSRLLLGRAVSDGVLSISPFASRRRYFPRVSA